MRCVARTHRFRRRGGSYILVLGTAMLVSVIGLSSISVSRIQVRTTGWSNDAREAGILAFSAVEFALAKLEAETVNDNPNWRSNYGNAVEQPGVPMGNGVMSWMLVDTDGNLADDNADPLVLYGVGTVGDARRVYRVSLEPSGLGLSCLEVTLHAGNALNFDRSTLNSDRAISANNSVIESGSTINANVEAVNAISGTGYSGSTTTGISPRQMPDPNTVFKYYVENGTRIDRADLPIQNGSVSIDSVLLTEGVNPWGAANKLGIYVIECGSQDFRVTNSRIRATLVLLNCGELELGYGVYWEPAVVNYPALLVQGGVLANLVSTDALSEANLGINFNPPGTPWQGMEDADTNDVYPNVVRGIVYATSDIIVTNEPAFEGSVVAGNSVITYSSTVIDLVYRSTSFYNPPPGFRAGGRVFPTPGSWTRATLP